jgi:hypothetical protein
MDVSRVVARVGADVIPRPVGAVGFLGLVRSGSAVGPEGLRAAGGVLREQGSQGVNVDSQVSSTCGGGSRLLVARRARAGLMPANGPPSPKRLPGPDAANCQEVGCRVSCFDDTVDAEPSPDEGIKQLAERNVACSDSGPDPAPRAFKAPCPLPVTGCDDDLR